MFFRYLQFETVSTRRIQVALRHYRRPIKIWCDVHVLLLNQLSKRPREVRQTLGELSSSGRQKQFQTYPNSDSRLPSSAAHPPSTTSSSASAARTQYVRSSSDYVRSRYLSVLPGTDCFAGAATRRSLSTDTTLSPTPSARTLSSARTSPSFRFLPSPHSLHLSR